MATAFGLRAYTGWAVAIAIGGDARDPVVTARRRLALQAPDVPTEVYHIASGFERTMAAEFIAHAIEASEAAAFAAVTDLLREAKMDAPDAVVGLVVGRGPPSAPPARPPTAHARKHGAEGEMYRYAVLRGAERAGLRVSMYPERDLDYLAGEAVGLSPRELSLRLTRLGAALGPPWTQREKSAALAGWLALTET